jgi:hypothetical protein
MQNSMLTPAQQNRLIVLEARLNQKLFGRQLDPRTEQMVDDDGSSPLGTGATVAGVGAARSGGYKGVQAVGENLDALSQTKASGGMGRAYTRKGNLPSLDATGILSAGKVANATGAVGQDSRPTSASRATSSPPRSAPSRGDTASSPADRKATQESGREFHADSTHFHGCAKVSASMKRPAEESVLKTAWSSHQAGCAPTKSGQYVHLITTPDQRQISFSLAFEIPSSFEFYFPPVPRTLPLPHFPTPLPF